MSLITKVICFAIIAVYSSSFRMNLKNMNQYKQIKMIDLDISFSAVKSLKAVVRKTIALSVGVLSLSTLPYYDITLPESANAQSEYKYMKEPTDDFKDEIKKTADLRKKDLETRKLWDDIVNEIKASEDPATTAASIKKLNVLLNKIQTIPVGVKKLDLVKTCRAKKFEGKKIRKDKWTKEVEIEYEAMIQQFNRQFNPKNPGDKTI